MQLALFSALFIAALSSAAFSGPDRKQNEALFFTGVMLLEIDTTLKPAEKGRKLRELEALTGISAAQGQAALRGYRKRPEEWQKLHAIMKKELAELEKGPKKKDTTLAAKPVADSMKTAMRKKTSSLFKRNKNKQ
jgi:hypothetical protein